VKWGENESNRTSHYAYVTADLLNTVLTFFSLFYLLQLFVEWSGVEFRSDGQSASTPWGRAAFWGPWPDFTCSLVWHVLASSCRAPSLATGRVLFCNTSLLFVQIREGPITIYYCLIWDSVPFPSSLMTHNVTVEVF
jgi:hypothetical protein